MIKIYGQPLSRAARPLWMAHELGLKFENIPVVANDPNYDDINPNRKMPFMVDSDGTTMFESLAISQYLVRQYGKEHPISPQNNYEEAALLQWSMWVMTEMDMRLHEIGCILMPEGAHMWGSEDGYKKYFGRPKSKERLQRLINELQFPLGVLNKALAKTPFLAGDRFTAADLNASVVMAWLIPEIVPLDAFPNIQPWLEKCFDREHCPFNRTQRPSWAKRVALSDVPGSKRQSAKQFPMYVFDVDGFNERYGKL